MGQIKGRRVPKGRQVGFRRACDELGEGILCPVHCRGGAIKRSDMITSGR